MHICIYIDSMSNGRTDVSVHLKWSANGQLMETVWKSWKSKFQVYIKEVMIENFSGMMKENFPHALSLL